jgi:ribosomal protein S18 acetylase RimI-like enzyme
LLEANVAEKAADRLSIRACRLEDIPVVLELWRQADPTPGVTDTAEDLRRVIRDGPAVLLVAEVEGRLVGSIIGTFDGWRGNIYRLAVHPDCRRQGVARALVEKDYPWAMSFWEAVGYRVDQRVVRRVRNL